MNGKCMHEIQYKREWSEPPHQLPLRTTIPVLRSSQQSSQHSALSQWQPCFDWMFRPSSPERQHNCGRTKESYSQILPCCLQFLPPTPLPFLFPTIRLKQFITHGRKYTETIKEVGFKSRWHVWGILYYCFPAYCGNILIKNNSPNTRYKNFYTGPFFGQGLANICREDEKDAHTATQNATLSLGLLWLNLSAAFVIPASVAWHEAKQDLHAVQQDMQPAGPVPD